jgi:hypothetical protein
MTSSMMLTAFNKLLQGSLSDTIIWTADLTYWMSGQYCNGTADPAWDTEEGYLAFHHDIGVMPYYYYQKFWTGSVEYSSEINIQSKKVNRSTHTTITTPFGELEEVSLYLPESCSDGIVKHFIENKNDLDILRYLIGNRKLKPTHLDDHSERRKIWEQYDGYPCLGLPRSPLTSFFYEWAGLENGIYLLADYEDEIREIFTMMEEQEKPVIDAICNLSPPLVHFPDNLSSENIAGLYDEWMLPTHKRRLERLHNAGIAAAVHLDGTIRGLLPKLSMAGFDAIEALTPMPVGDVSVEDMRIVAGNDDVILWGGVPGAMFAPPFTWKDMEKHIEQLLSAWHGSRFIIGVADQVPPDGDITFCRKIADMLR